MTLCWSRHATQVLSVFSPWQKHDGYAVDVLAIAERRLDIHIPTVLKDFYCAWGLRASMTRFRQTLLTPEQLDVQSGVFIFAEENQAVYRWGIPCDLLPTENPPVYYAVQPPENELPIWQLSHEHVSDFLDYLIYGHALAGGAPHGGMAHESLNATQVDKIQHTWTAIELASVPMGLFPNPQSRWVLYGQPGIVLDPQEQVWVASQAQDALEEVHQQLGLTWEHMW